MALKKILKVSFILAFTVSAVLNAETTDISIQYETGGYYEGEFNDGTGTPAIPEARSLSAGDYRMVFPIPQSQINI